METFSALLAICAGNSPVSGEFPLQRPVARSFNVFFDLRLSKRLSKQSWGWWFETLPWPLWPHCNVYLLTLWLSASLLPHSDNFLLLHATTWEYLGRLGNRTPRTCASHPGRISHFSVAAQPAALHHDVIKWKHFSRNWAFVTGTQRSPVDFTHKGN